MGVKGLWRLLRPLAHSLPYSKLKNCRIAIDISIWLNKLQKIHNKDGSVRTTNEIILIIFKKLCELKLAGIKAIFVFDGPSIELKREVAKKRRLARNLNKEKAEKIREEITKTALLEYAQNDPQKPSLEALKKINQIETKDELVFNETPLAKIDNFYIPYDLKLIDIDSDEFDKLKTTQKYEYLTFLHDYIKHQFEDSESHSKFSNSQVDKFILLGKINRKIDEISSIIPNDFKKNSKKITVNNCPILSNKNQFYLFLKDSGLISDKNIPSTKTNEVKINPSIEFKSLSYNEKPKINIFKINRPRPLSSESSESSEELAPELPDETIFIKNEENISQTSEIQKTEKSIKRAIDEIKVQKFSPVKDSEIKAKIEVLESPKSEKTENLDKKYIKTEKNNDFMNLVEKYSKFYTRSSSVPRDLFIECCHLISIMGMSFIVAPGEAEAQCAFLQNLNLCDLISTEDSDSFLFGAKKIIRGLFSIKSKTPKLASAVVEFYDVEDVLKILGLTQERFICLGILSGCDYFPGIKGIGVSKAYKLICKTKHKKAGRILRKVSKFRNFEVKNVEFPKNFPPRNVIRSFRKPLVDTNTSEFAWNPLNDKYLKGYLLNKSLMNQDEIDICIKTINKNKDDGKEFIFDIDKQDESVLLLFSKEIRDSRNRYFQ